MGILFAILNSILLGAANVLLKKSYKDFVPSVSFFIISIFALLLWAPLGLVLGVDFNQWVLGFFIGLLSAIFGQLIYIYVLEKGELSITATILSTFSVYTILFSVLFNKESLSSLTMLLIILIILGTIIVSLPERFKKEEFKKVNFILWAVFAAVCIGASDTLSKYFINRSTVGSFLFYVSIAQVLVSFLYLKIEKQPLNQFREIFNDAASYKFALLGSLAIAISTMFLFLAFNFTLASIASPIAASAPIITVILTVAFLREKITIKNLIGLILVIASVISLGFLNPA